MRHLLLDEPDLDLATLRMLSTDHDASVSLRASDLLAGRGQDDNPAVIDWDGEDQW